MKYFKILLAICVLSLVGCVSVDSLKTQLNSSDASAVSKGKNKILEIMGRGWYNHETQYGVQRISDKDMISLLRQIEDNDFLLEIIDVLKNNNGRDKDVFKEACSRVRFADEAKAISFLRKYKYSKEDYSFPWKEFHIAHKSAVEAVSSEQGLQTIYDEFNADTMDDLKFKSTGDGGMRLDLSLKDMVNLRVAQKIKNQQTLAKIARQNHYSDKASKIAIERITDDNILFSLLGGYTGGYTEEVVSRMSKKFIVKKLLEVTDEEYTHARAMVKVLNHDKILAYLATKAKSKHVRWCATIEIKDKSILVGRLKELDSSSANEVISKLLESELTTDMVHNIVTNLPIGVNIDLQLTLAKKIEDGKVAKSYFETIDFSGDYEFRGLEDEEGKTIGWRAFDILSLLLNKMSEDDKKELEDKAFETANTKEEDKIVFEGLYTGMPFVDFVIVVNAHKIKPASYKSSYKDVNGNTRSDLRKKNWRNESRIWGFQIFTSDVMKFVDCEDVDTLHQIIHKYVMKREGKCTRLQYLSLINHRIEDNSSSHTNLFTGETSYNIDVKGWEIYSNTKRNTRISFSEKQGRVRFD
jgi:hypothetical protein